MKLPLALGRASSCIPRSWSPILQWEPTVLAAYSRVTAWFVSAVFPQHLVLYLQQWLADPGIVGLEVGFLDVDGASGER